MSALCVVGVLLKVHVAVARDKLRHVKHSSLAVTLRQNGSCVLRSMVRECYTGRLKASDSQAATTCSGQWHNIALGHAVSEDMHTALAACSVTLSEYTLRILV